MALRGSTEDDRHGDWVAVMKVSKGEAAFRGHLMVYLCTGLFLFTLNLLTSPGDWWFQWPLFFWGWAVIFQAVATFGTQAPARIADTLRSIVPGLTDSSVTSAAKPRRKANAAPFAAAAFATAHEHIERLREISAQLPEGPAREHALRLCASADRIAAAMAADRASEEMVRWFDSQLLEPTVSLLDRYARLAMRDVPGTEETLRRVEEQNLPLLESRFDALYTQLHRGEIVDLAVASEMLELDPPELLRLSTQPAGKEWSRV